MFSGCKYYFGLTKERKMCKFIATKYHGKARSAATELSETPTAK